MKKILTTCLLSLAVLLVSYAQSNPEGIVSYWKFDLGYGTTVIDSEDGNNGMIYGALWGEGLIENALYFYGNEYVNCGNPENLKIYPPLSIEIWVNLSVVDPNAPTSYLILSKGDQAFRYYSMMITPWGHFVFIVEASAINVEIEAEQLLEPNEWYHVVGVHDGEHVYIYVNGDLKNHADAPLKPDYYLRYSNAPMTIGIEPSYMYNPNFWFKGVIDEFAIYNRALTPEEIQCHYQNGLNGLGFDANCSLEAIIDINPNTLNKKSNGKWITAYIKLPEGNDINDIDITTIELEYESQKISSKWGEPQGNLYMVKFSRQALIDILGSITGYVELKVLGKVDNKPFEGTDTIRVK